MKKNRLDILIICLVSVFLHACSANEEKIPGCYDLVVLRPRFEGQATQVYAISNGFPLKAVGTCADTAVVWTVDNFGAQITPLPMVPGCFRSVATDITDNGKICGYGIRPGSMQIIPAVWENNQVNIPAQANLLDNMTHLGLLSIASNGQTTGTSKRPAGQVAYIIQPDGRLEYPYTFGGDTACYLTDIEKGSYGACGNYAAPGQNEKAFYADQSGIRVLLNPLAGDHAVATRLSGNREEHKVYIGGKSIAVPGSPEMNGISHGVIWEVTYGASSLTVNTVDCGTLNGADDGIVNACNSKRIAVGSSGGFGIVWSGSDGMIKLNNLVHAPPALTDWYLANATDINEEGRICGDMATNLGKVSYLLTPGDCSSISMQKTAPDVVRKNGILEYSFMINNSTGNNSASVTVTDKVPPNTIFDISLTQSENWVYSNGSVSVTKNISAGTSVSLKLLLRVTGQPGEFITNDQYGYTINGTDTRPVNIPRITRITENPGLVFNDDRQCFTAEDGARVNYTADESLLTGTGFDRIEFFEGINRIGSVSSAPFTLLGSVLHKGFLPVRAVAMRGNMVVKTYRPLCIVVGDMDTPSPVYEIIELAGMVNYQDVDLNDSNVVSGPYMGESGLWRNGVPTAVSSPGYRIESINNQLAMFFLGSTDYQFRFPDGSQNTIGPSFHFPLYRRKLSIDGKILLSESEWLAPPAIPKHHVWNGNQLFKLQLPQQDDLFAAPKRMTDNGFVIGFRRPSAPGSQWTLCYGNSNQPNANGEIPMTDIAGAPQFIGSGQTASFLNSFGTIGNINTLMYVNPANPSQLLGTSVANPMVDATNSGSLRAVNDADMFSGDYVFQSNTPQRKAFLWICGKAYKLENLVANPGQQIFSYIEKINIDGSILCGVYRNFSPRYVLLKPIR
jgi:hypothetical protein